VDIARFAGTSARGRTPVGQETLRSLAFLGLTLVPVMFLGFRGIQWTEVALSDDLVEMGTWVKANSPEASQYLYLGNDHDVAEWLPYLVRRTPGISPWGAEWTGNYDLQNGLWGELSSCVGARVGCLDEFWQTCAEHHMADRPWRSIGLGARDFRRQELTRSSKRRVQRVRVEVMCR
jgi:hypothetical protein